MSIIKRNIFRDLYPLPGGKVFRHEIHLLHGEHAAPQVLQQPGVGGEGKGQLIGIEGLEGTAVLLVVPLPAILAVPQQGMAGGGELGADLVGAAGEQLALYQGQSARRPQSLI